MSNLFQTVKNSVKHWYVPLLLGILFIIFGVYIFTVPLATYISLALLFSISFLVSGILDVVFSIENRKNLSGWGWYLTGGILTLLLGFYLVMNTEITMEILPFVVGFTMMFRSFQALAYAFDLREMKVVKWGDLALLASLGILFSFLLLSNPIFTGLSLVSLTGASFLIIGVAYIVFSFRLKKVKDFPKKLSKQLGDKIDQITEEVKNEMNA